MTENSNITFATLSENFSIAIDDIHKFSTDSVLLSHFAKVKSKDKLIDLCSGCGIVGFCYYRDGATPPLLAVGVDIQIAALELMKETINRYDIKSFTPILQDLKEIPQKGVLGFGHNYFDVATCNPPYQTEQSGFIASEGRGVQRHELMCSLADIATAARASLKYGGRFCVCHRPTRLADLIVELRNANIEPKRLRFVHKNKNSPPWLILLEGKVGAKSHLVVEAPLFMYDDNGKLSAEVAKIYESI